jgi:hypothetical protein
VDRLLRLSQCRLALRHVGPASPDEFRHATLMQRILLRHCYGQVRQLVEAGHPDAMRALFTDLTWLVAMVGADPAARALSVHDRPLGEAGGEVLSLLSRG